MLKQIKLENGDVAVVDSSVVGHLSGWIDSLFRASRNLPDFGALSSLLLDTNKKIYFHGGYFAPHCSMPLSYAMGEEYFGQYPGTRQVDVITFYCAIISKELVEKLGIPETLGASIFDDADYCLQAAAQGFKIYSTDKLVTVYQGGPHDRIELAQATRSFGSKMGEFQARWGALLNSHYKTPVLYMARVTEASGFSMAAINYLRSLHRNGVKVFFEPLDTVLDGVLMTEDELVNSVFTARGDMYMPQITWGQAPYFVKNSGVYKIGHCEFECTEIPEVWPHYCNMLDELWVPSEWDRKKFIKAGVNVPIYVIYQGIDPDYFHPDYAPMQVDAPESFKFLVNAAWYPRKNLHNLITAFQSEFKRGEDVCLIVKTINLGLNEGIKNEVDKIRSDDNAANVYIKEDCLPNYKLPSLYTMADCFVLPTRGEGWGLPLFEALACGLPVITTGYGAPNEVLRGKDGKPYPGVHFTDYREVDTVSNYVYDEGLKWAEPNMAQFAAQMREVYEHRREEKAAALKTSAIIRNRFSWDRVTLAIRDRLDDIYKNKLSRAKS